MRNSLDQLDTLVNQVLAFEAQNRRPGGRQAMANTLIDVEAFIGELTEQYLPVASAKGLRLVVEVEPGLAVWSVPARLQRGLPEVLDNAVR